MLGMAGVQGVSLRGNQAAYYRTMATTLSGDIVERMRSNISAVDAGSCDDVTGAVTAACITAAGCSGAQMAAQDVLDWSAAVAAALPLGAGVICLDSTPTACDGTGNIYAIKLWWDDDRDRDGTEDQGFRSSFQPL